MLVLKTIIAIASLCGLGYGVLMGFAASLSDNPQMGAEVGRSAGWLAGISLVGLIGSIVWAFH